MEQPSLDKLREQFQRPREQNWHQEAVAVPIPRLRHFSVTTLIAAGVDVRTVADRHGHANATMTLNRYAHALPERDREAAGVLGASLTRGVLSPFVLKRNHCRHY